jgi:hypothetical protein
MACPMPQLLLSLGGWAAARPSKKPRLFRLVAGLGCSKPSAFSLIASKRSKWSRALVNPED